MSQINNITALQVAQKGSEQNFYSSFRTKTPYNQCRSRVIQVGSSWGGFGSLPAVKSGVVGVPSLNCISNSNKNVLTNNISVLPAANGEQFLGFGYSGATTESYPNIYV
jgi:hypothetical protein